MSPHALSRRQALGALGGAWIAGPLGLSTWPSRGVAAEATPMTSSVIDTHVHIASSRIPSGPSKNAPPSVLDLPEQAAGAPRLARLIEQEMKAAGVTHALCMPSCDVSEKDPLGIQATLAQAALVQGPKLYAIGIAHPKHFDPPHLARVEEVLKQGQVKALKAYLGYFHYEATSPGYRPYYQLAAKYHIPVIFHTGDTYSPVAKVKYAHPLQVDELAVDFPETTFVLAHFGNPWVMDAAQVVYKNKNVWAELSAFLIGDTAQFAAMEKSGVVTRTVERVKEGIEYAEAPERFVFGSDWPLSPIAAYRDFVRQLFPDDQHAAVLHTNAKKLYGLS